MNRTSASDRKIIAALIACTLAARFLVICIWPSRAVSVDLHDWRTVAAALLVGLNPYVAFRTLNWPPLWMGVLYFLGRISDRFDLDIFNCIRVFLTIADAVLVASAYALSQLLQPKGKHFRLLIVGLVLNPLMILLTVGQGNFDVLPVIGIVWFLYFLIRFRRGNQPQDWLSAAAALGLATLAKTFPLALIPLLIADSRKLPWRFRFLGLALCVGPAFLALAPLYLLAPREITQNVLLYRGTPGAVGLSGILTLSLGYDSVVRYMPWFTCFLAVALCTLTILLWLRPMKNESKLILLAAAILLGMFLFGTGYCPQYWMWVTPLLVISYSLQPPAFKRIVLASAILIVTTVGLTFAYDRYLGCFIAWIWPTDFNLRLRAYFGDVLHDLILISLPMTAATLILWISCVRILIRNAPQSPPTL
jgi:dolichyl-phosphate-mannose-protein mannosyltransferase